MKLLIVSGLSGAGKSVAMNALEDIGFFCIDNIPSALLPSITAFSKAGDNQLKRVALCMDVRGCRTPEEIEEALSQLDAQRIEYEILFLDAPDDVLMRRYSETRRRHPISIAEGISTREARSFTAHIIQPIAASAARMMIHLTKFGSFFIEDPSNPFYTLFYIFRFYSGLQSFRAHLSSSSACWLSSCFTHAPRAAAPSPVLPASAKLARSESVRLCHAEKPSGAMCAPRRQSSTAVFPVGRHGLPRNTVPAGQSSETKSQSQNTNPRPSARPEGAVT